MGVRAPSDKRFRRSHVKPSGRRLASRLRWRRLGQVFVLLALVAYAVDRAAKLVLNASGLAIDQIEVQGHTQLSTGEVLALVSGLRGQNILTAQIDTWRNRLVMSPWVKDAALRKVMPSKIKITVLEKAPVSLGRVDKELYLIDEHGDVIDKDGPQYDFDLPIVDGLFERVDAGPPVVAPARAQLAQRFIGELSLRPELWRRVSQIDVANTDDVVVLLDGDSALLHLGNVGFADRIHAYLEMAEALRDHVAEIDYVDLRYGERVYVRPVGSKASALAVP